MDADILVSTIKNMLYNNETVEVQTVQKGNRTLTGISIGNENIRPVVYIEDYNDLFMKHGYQEVAREMIKVCSNTEMIDFDMKKVVSWDFVKRHLILCIGPKGTNVGCVTIPYLDLELYFRVNVSKGEDRIGSYKVKNEMIAIWNITIQDMLQAAQSTNNYIVSSMLDVIMELMSESQNEMIEAMEAVPQVIVTNRKKFYGASAIYDKEILKRLADKYKSDLCIIPSSVHELIVSPTNDFMSLTEVNKMIKEVNETQVSPEERLSDHAYIFHRDTMEITW